MNPKRYSMIVQWGEEDQVYIVTVPELPGCKTHGKDRIEAVKNAIEVIDLCIEVAEKDGRPVPPPRYYSYTEEDDEN